MNPTSGLSFVDGRNFWNPDRTGDYDVDCATGRAAAEELVDYINETGNHLVFKNVIHCIQAYGQMGGVEIGFCHALSLKLMVPAAPGDRDRTVVVPLPV